MKTGSSQSQNCSLFYLTYYFTLYAPVAITSALLTYGSLRHSSIFIVRLSVTVGSNTAIFENPIIVPPKSFLPSAYIENLSTRCDFVVSSERRTRSTGQSSVLPIDAWFLVLPNRMILATSMRRFISSRRSGRTSRSQRRRFPELS